MHAPPPFQMTVHRDGAWRWGCVSVVAVAAVAVLPWALVASTVHPAWVAVAAATALVAAVAVTWQAWRLDACSLRWDGQSWHLGSPAERGQEPIAGRLAVRADLGAWMLLHFTPATGRRGRWIPVGRKGHEAAWASLRATVYFARPASLPTAAPF